MITRSNFLLKSAWVVSEARLWLQNLGMVVDTLITGIIPESLKTLGRKLSLPNSELTTLSMFGSSFECGYGVTTVIWK